MPRGPAHLLSKAAVPSSAPHAEGAQSHQWAGMGRVLGRKGGHWHQPPQTFVPKGSQSAGGLLAKPSAWWKAGAGWGEAAAGTWGHTDAHRSITGSQWGVLPKPQCFQPKAAVLALRAASSRTGVPPRPDLPTPLRAWMWFSLRYLCGTFLKSFICRLSDL